LVKTRTGRTIFTVSAFALAVLAFHPAGTTPAFAQDRPRNLFELLFSSPRPPPREIPETPAPQIKKKPVAKPRASKQRKSSASVAAAPVAPLVEKAENARVVLVLGDFLSDGTAEGLDEAFVENATVRVVDKSSGSSGLVRDDYYDWIKNAPGIIDAEKPAAVVVMLGSNDRQELKVDGNREPVRSAAWMKEYETRVNALAKAVRDKNVPLIWVGMPPFKHSGTMADMLAFNDAYKTGAEAVGGTFVDIWDGFVDENGAYVTQGPDIKGAPVRLRSGQNGINFTSAAKRKVAFYIEKPLERILGAQTGLPAIGASQIPPIQQVPVTPADIDRTNPMFLSDPELDGGGELMGASFEPAKAPQTQAQRLTVDGIAAPPVAGRADDFGDGTPAKAAAPAPPSQQKTTAIVPQPKG